jgi:hypothetical protein
MLAPSLARLSDLEDGSGRLMTLLLWIAAAHQDTPDCSSLPSLLTSNSGPNQLPAQTCAQIGGFEGSQAVPASLSGSQLFHYSRVQASRSRRRSYFTTDSQSVSQYVLVSSTLVGLATRYYLLSECSYPKFTVLYLLGALSDERTFLL